VIEGNSFLDFVYPDFAVMCARAEGGKVKASARRALLKSDVLYLSTLDEDKIDSQEMYRRWREKVPVNLRVDDLPILTLRDLPQLTTCITHWGKLARQHFAWGPTQNQNVGSIRG
jgi:hypothetical protein